MAFLAPLLGMAGGAAAAGGAASAAPAAAAALTPTAAGAATGLGSLGAAPAAASGGGLMSSLSGLQGMIGGSSSTPMAQGSPLSYQKKQNPSVTQGNKDLMEFLNSLQGGR
jgi:hypothetical protein